MVDCVTVNNSEFNVQQSVCPSLCVVLRVDGDVVSRVVANSGARDVDLDVHAAAVGVVPVQVPVHLKLERKG